MTKSYFSVATHDGAPNATLITLAIEPIQLGYQSHFASQKS